MPTQARTAGARQFFSRHGTLSKWHPKYEFRSGQVERDHPLAPLPAMRILTQSRTPAAAATHS
jgi:hypothetical protein